MTVYGTPGPYEDAVIDTPIFEENDLEHFKGIDIMRSVRSFDPCLPCGVHMYLGKGKVLEEAALAHPGGRPRAVLLRGAMAAPQNLRAVGDQIEQLLDELQRHRGSARRTTGPRAAAAGHRALRRGAGPDRRAGRATDAGLIDAWRPTTWWPACCSCTASTRRPSTAESRRPWPRSGRFWRTHGGDVELLGIDADAGAVRLRLLGSCDGCPSSSVTLQMAVERAITAAAPEIVADRRGRADPAADRRCPVTLGDQAGVRRMPGRMADGVTDPLAVAPAHPPGAARREVRGRERCELCAEPISDDHGHLVDLQARNLLCACRGCYLLFVSEGAGGSALPGGSRPVPGFLGLRAVRRPVGSLQIPVERGLLLRELRRSGGWRRSTRGPRAPPSPNFRWTPGRRWWRPTRCWRNSNPTSRHSWSGPIAGGETECFSSRSTPATSWSADLRRLWRGFDGGREASDAIDAFFDRACRGRERR